MHCDAPSTRDNLAYTLTNTILEYRNVFIHGGRFSQFKEIVKHISEAALTPYAGRVSETQGTLSAQGFPRTLRKN